MLFFIDVDNKKRYKIQNSINDKKIKNLARDYKMTGEDIMFSLKGIGILELDDVIIDYPIRSVIFKTTMVYDLNGEVNIDEEGEDFEYGWNGYGV